MMGPPGVVGVPFMLSNLLARVVDCWSVRSHLPTGRKFARGEDPVTHVARRQEKCLEKLTNEAISKSTRFSKK